MNVAHPSVPALERGAIPPHDLEAERAVLGALLVSGRDRVTEVQDVLRPEHFYRTAHQVIYRAVLRLAARHQAIDLVTVDAALRQAGEHDRAGGPAYVAQLVDGVPYGRHARSYAAAVVDRWRRRTAIARLDAASAALQATDDSPTETLAGTIADLQALIAGETDVPLEAEAGAAQVLRELCDPDAPRDAGWTVGLPSLDAVVRLRRGQLVLIGARTSQGKTSLCAQIAAHLAREVSVLFASLEMPAARIMHLIAQQLGEYDLSKVEMGRATDEDLARVRQGATALASLGPRLQVLGPQSRQTVAHLRALAMRCRQERGDLGAIIVDYVGLLDPAPVGKQPRWDAMAGVSRDLKYLATKLACVVIVAAQVNRAAAERAEQTRTRDPRERLLATRPRLHDLRDTGALEQDSDLVLLLHWQTDEPYHALCDVAKHREGKCAQIDVAYHPQTRRFLEAV